MKLLFQYDSRKQVHVATLVTFRQYLRLQNGGAGENAAEFAFTSVHVVVAPPINSSPELQV